MKQLFMLCNSCQDLCTRYQYWLVDHKNCACIFLEEAPKPYPPTDLNGHTMSIYAQAVEADRLFTQELIKHMTPKELERFCLENGFAVPEKNQ